MACVVQVAVHLSSLEVLLPISVLKKTPGCFCSCYSN
uniref:Uncharacterized protein n=1 Tax=Anguilla anguilla TaxID=7936 RepID=A0A0E9RTC6_ANGAN